MYKSLGYVYNTEITNDLTKNNLCLSFKSQKLCLSFERKNTATNPNFEQIYKISTSFYSKSSTWRYIFYYIFDLIRLEIVFMEIFIKL